MLELTATGIAAAFNMFSLQSFLLQSGNEGGTAVGILVAVILLFATIAFLASKG